MSDSQKPIAVKVGDRTPGDEGSDPNDDIQAVLGAGPQMGLHSQGRTIVLTA